MSFKDFFAWLFNRKPKKAIPDPQPAPVPVPPPIPPVEPPKAPTEPPKPAPVPPPVSTPVEPPKQPEIPPTVPYFGIGEPKVGAVLTRVSGSYPGYTPIAGRRYRDEVLIPGATQADYKIAPEDSGKTLVYEEQFENDASLATFWARSAPVKVPFLWVDPPKPVQGIIETAMNDMALRNDFTLKGYEHRTDGWYVASDNGMAAHPWIDSTSTASWSEFYNHRNYWGKECRAMLPWAAVFEGTKNTSRNATFEIVDVFAFVLNKADKWTRVTSNPSMYGELYQTPNSSAQAQSEQRVSNTIIRAPSTGLFWHGWGSKVQIDPNDVKAVHVRLRARLVSGSEGAEFGLQVGNDYYLAMDQRYTDTGYAPSSHISRTKKLTTEFQDFTATTLTDCGSQNPGKTGITCAQLKANPPV